VNESILVPLEAALSASAGNMELARAYAEAGIVAGAPQRVARLFERLGIVRAQLGDELAARLGRTLLQLNEADLARTWLDTGDPQLLLHQARDLLARGQTNEAGDCYRRAVAANPALEDKAFEAELDGRVVRLIAGQRPARIAAHANDDTDADETVRLIHPEAARVTFEDVGGLSAIKTQIRRRIITPFQKPSLFQRFRKSAGGGVLLYGPPGCGKTLLARATAGECGAAFFNVAVSDVLDMYIGESERKLHAVFEQARRKRPAVLFFDEVEALGGKRQYTRESSSSKLVSQFLSELDGFAQNNAGVLILAATNVPWAVDPAFRRPGRFDRVLFVPPPDLPARREILKHLIEQRPTAGTIDVEFLARATTGYSGADLRDIVETAVDEAIEASINAGRETPITDAMVKTALKQTRPTTQEWLTTARNYARYANEGGQYDDVLAFLREQGVE
jgi:ATP-dependent 26S proteasome regulatory subunit